jgi:hypothetical protein
MGSRGGWAFLLVVAVSVFAGIAVWWNDFLYSDSCLDAGGMIENGLCVGARHYVPSFLEAPWQLKAFTLLPPAVVAAVILVMPWVVKRKGW